jgi:hypothetical protein
MRARVGRARKLDLILATAVVAWVAIVFAGFFPGLMSPDSLLQYDQGLTGSYTNQHPPVLSALIGLCARAVGSPWPLLLFDLIAIAGSLALLARRARTGQAVALFVVCLLLPPVWAVANTIWKDVVMAAFLLIAVAALAWNRPFVTLTALLSATLMRHNAVLAALPLLPAVWSRAFPAWKASRRWIAAGVSALLLFAAPPLAERALHTRQLCLVCGMAEYDLAGVYVDDPTGYSSSVLAPFVSLDELRRVYRHDTNGFLVSYVPEKKMFELFDSVPEWKAALRHHPFLVAKNKLLTFSHTLGLWPHVMYPFHTDIDQAFYNTHGLKRGGSERLYGWLRAVEESMRNGLLFRGALWLALAIAVGVMGLLRKRRLAVAVAASGVVYLLSFLPLGSSSDFRYVFWTVLSGFAAAILLSVDEKAPAG